MSSRMPEAVGALRSPDVLAESAPVRSARWISGLRFAVAVAPLVVGLGLLYLWMGHTPQSYLPVQSDELSYWHQIVAFSHVGFGNGYYTYQEYTPAVPSAYGAWGPTLPVLYGSVLAVFGTSYSAVVWLNLAVFAVLVFGALSVARPDLRRTLLLGLTLITYTPLLMYVPSGMQEPLNLALAVVLAVLFLRLLTAQPGARRWPTVWLCLAIILASALRATWALLFLPAVLLAARGMGRRVLLKAAAAGSIATVALALLFPLWAAPAPYGYTYRIRHGATLADKFGLLAENIGRNVALYVDGDALAFRTTIVERFQLLAVLLAVAVVAVLALSRRKWRGTEAAAFGWSVGLALAGPLAFIVCFYDIGNGVRVLGAHTLFAAVLAGLWRRRWAIALPALLILTNIASAGWFHHDFVARNRINFNGDRATIEAMRASIAGELRFRPDVNRWCNTVLLSTDYGFFYQLVSVEPGIGLSVDLNHKFQGLVKSAYVLVSDANVALLPANLELLRRTPQGGLYRNLDSPCYA